jgi:hypothetical protein
VVSGTVVLVVVVDVVVVVVVVVDVVVVVGGVRPRVTVMTSPGRAVAPAAGN